MWARVDDGWWCHPKVMGLSLAARGVWVSALSWSCAQRSATVPIGFLGMIRADFDLADEITRAGLWIATEHGWEIHDWAEYQDLSLSERRAEAGRKGGKRSGEARRSKPKQTPDLTSGNDEANPKPDEATAEAGPSRPDPSHPDPDPGSSDGLPEVVEPPADPDAAAEDREQTIRAAAVAVGRAEALAHGGTSGYAASVTKRILTDPDRSDRDRIRLLVDQGQTPEQIAASWQTDPFSTVAGVDLEAKARATAEAAERAKRREAETADRLAAQRAETRTAPPADLRRGLRAVDDPPPSPATREANA